MSIHESYAACRQRIIIREDAKKGGDSLMAALVLSATFLVGVMVTLTIQDYTSINDLKWQLIGGGSLGLFISAIGLYLTYKVRKEEERNIVLTLVDQKKPNYPNLTDLSQEKLLGKYRYESLRLINYFDEKEAQKLDENQLKQAILRLFDETFIEKSATKTRQNMIVLALGLIAALAALFTVNHDWEAITSSIGILGLSSFIGTISLISLIYSSIKLQIRKKNIILNYK